MKNTIIRICIAAACALVAGCYAGGIGHWKAVPQTPVAEHCKRLDNRCGEPWMYPPLHD